MPLVRGPARAPRRSSTVPVGLKLAFADEFDQPLSIESGTLPTTGATWGDAFEQFSVRNLAANNDECLKGRPDYANGAGPTFASLGMHTFQQAGSSLLMSAYEIPTNSRPDFFGFPYAGPQLDSRRSMNLTYGYVEVRARFVSLGAGTHWSVWLWPSDRNDFELDLVEVIGSNNANPNGDVTSLFLNSHDNRAGSTHSDDYPFDEIDITAAELRQWHTYGIEITATDINWFIDGVQERTIPNVYPADTPWHLYVTLEMGSNAGGDFPGAVNSTTPLPNTAELSHVRVYTADGTLVIPPSLPLTGEPPVLQFGDGTDVLFDDDSPVEFAA